MFARCIPIAFVLLLLFPIIAAGEIEISFSMDSLTVEGDKYEFGYAELQKYVINENLTLPVKTIHIKSGEEITREDIILTIANQKYLGSVDPANILSKDRFTGFISTPTDFAKDKISKIANPLFSVKQLRRQNENYTAISVLPVSVTADGQLFFNENITLTISKLYEDVQKSMIHQLLKPQKHEYVEVNKTADSYGVPLGDDYLIITTDLLAPAFSRLIDYRKSQGLTVGIALIDSIAIYYEGVDIQEKIRNYLKDYNHASGSYLLLGGDNIAVPVRYLYYYNTDQPVSNPYYMMPSDLYYSDLDGEWDVDGDGIYGEPTDDAPNLIPELLTGRIPLSDSGSIVHYINKLINYETNPGNGSFDYLNRTLIFASDQMRDYPANGQHGVIAEQFPEYMEIDTGQTIEMPSGNDANPVNPVGDEGVERLSRGFGSVHIIAHGRIDGYVVRSSNYGDWPASFILSTPQPDEHGSVLDLGKNNKTGLYYSISCNLGGYDLDSTDGEPADWSLVERLISLDSAGAVAMVANSRWGWVYSSYHLEKAFTERLYGTSEGRPVEAMYSSWLDYPYYLDLIYGQNFFGDPMSTIYLDIPSGLEVQFQRDNSNQVYIISNDAPVAGAYISIAMNGELLESGYSSANGIYEIATDLSDIELYDIYVSKSGHTSVYEQFMPSITLDVDDETDNSILPLKFELFQNYPNPFNPTTTISFDLPQKSDVMVQIYNILGQTVEKFYLPNNQAGRVSIDWEAYDSNGSPLPSGVYFYRVSAGELIETRKMTLLK